MVVAWAAKSRASRLSWPASTPAFFFFPSPPLWSAGRSTFGSGDNTGQFFMGQPPCADLRGCTFHEPRSPGYSAQGQMVNERGWFFDMDPTAHVIK